MSDSVVIVTEKSSTADLLRALIAREEGKIVKVVRKED